MANDVITTDKAYGLPVSGMAPGLAIMFNDALYDRCKQIASVMARAQGFTPAHLIGHTEACFAVVTRAITWKLDPFSVAQATYQIKGGKVGFEGKLVQAILENSGHLVGPVKFTHFGDWDKIRGKWTKKPGTNGEYAVAAWKDEDETGLGVVVSAQVRGEDQPRELSVYMRECFPRNSTLWALRPSQQIMYTAVRAFANVAAPGLFMGVPFSSDLDETTMVDVTPSTRPLRNSPAFAASAETMDQPITDGAPVVAEQEQAPEQEADEQPAEEQAEYGVPDALEDGIRAQSEGKSMFSHPKEWVQLNREDLIDAFKEGWRSAEAEKPPRKK